MNIGIISTGVYLPTHRMTAKEISKHSNIPEDIIKTKLGIIEKTIAGPHDHTVQMAVWASKKALDKTNISPRDIDVIIYIGEEHKEYPLWTAAIKIQEEIGATNAWAFDVQLRCGTTIMALKVAKSLLLADDQIHTILLAGGYRNHDLINFSNERTRFMYNLGAGGGAILLQKGVNENILLETDIITDGSFSEDVVVPVGGTKQPLTPELLQSGAYQLEVLDPKGMKARLEQKSLNNFLKVIRRSLAKSGFDENNLGYLAILHMKKSAHDHILHSLGLTESQSIYLSHYGHIGQIDQILSLELAMEGDKLKKGDIVTLVSAGIGYAWGATTIQWGKQKEEV